MKRLIRISSVCLLLTVVAAAGCSLLPAAESKAEPPQATSGSNSPVFAGQTGSEIQQWAAEASASSEFTNDEWAADDATGAPDTERCGDYQTAWASAGSDAVSTLVLTYTQSVVPLVINVHESFNPDQVTEIRAIGDEGEQVIYEGEPRQIDQPCPYVLSVVVPDVDFQVYRLELTVDQSRLGLGWNEIDAVELIGTVD